ncbi:hypothetical protein LV82_01101 [Albidovulum inexpectatum]|uniref:Uncharacterized protein n=1 Tax=Albidovulum inexpectatum TaxID=196587 RepID=A0A2S5JK55_9RHOB|nr:hypothetical protein LV82_01101 [Albidovulum inexpectatum]
MRELRLMLHGPLDVSHEDVPSPTPEEDDEDEEDLIWMMVRDLPGDSVPLQRMRSLCLQLANIRRQRQEAQNRRRQQVKELEQTLECSLNLLDLRMT